MMWDSLDYGLVALCCTFAFFVGVRYLVLALMFRKRQSFGARPDIRPIAPDQRPPREAEASFKLVDGPLEEIGYQRAGDSANPNFHERLAGTNRIFVNRATRTMAIIIIGYRKNASGVWQFKWSTFAIRTDFTDGSLLVTSNSAALHARPSRPDHRSIRFVNIKDLRVLHQVHVAILERDYAGKIRDLVADSKFNGDVVRLTEWFSSEEKRRLVETGYFYHDTESDKLRPTLKGAYLTVWKNSWPWKQLRIRNRDREAARVLREIGLNEQGRPRTPPARSFPSEVMRARAAGSITFDLREGPGNAPRGDS